MEAFGCLVAALFSIGLILLFLLAVGVVAFDVWLTKWLFRWVIAKCEMTYAPTWAKGIVLAGIISTVLLGTLSGGFVLAVVAGGAAILRGLGTGEARRRGIDYGTEEPRSLPTSVGYPYEQEIEDNRRVREREEAERLAAREEAQRQYDDRPHPAFGTDHPAFRDP